MSWVYSHRKMIMLCGMALLAGLVLALYLGGMTVDDVIQYTSGAGALTAALTIIVLFCLKPLVVFSPSTALYLAAGILFNPAAAILVVYIGSALEAWVGYYLGRSLGRDQISQLLARHQRAQRVLTTSSATACFWSRALPIPFDLASMFYGASGTPCGRFVLFSLMGSSPWIIAWAFAGDAITTPLSREFLLPFGICMGLTVAVFLVSRRLQPHGGTER